MGRYARYVALPVVVAGLVIAARHVDLRGIGAALAGANAWLFALAAVIDLVGRTPIRAARTWALLDRRVPYRDVLRMTLAGYAASAILPGPAEDAVCSIALARDAGFTLRELARYQVTNQTLSAASVAVLGLAFLPLAAALAIGTAIVVLLVLFARRLLVPAALVLGSNVLCLAMIALCLAAVGAAIDPLVCVQLVFATALATALPITPGNLGTLESAFAFTAARHDIPPPVALAAAVLYHVALVAPVALVGLPQLCRLSWRTAP